MAQVLITLLAILPIGAAEAEAESVSEEPPKALVLEYEGAVDTRGAEDDKWEALTSERWLEFGTHIRTGEDASADLLFSDNDLVSVEAEHVYVVGEGKPRPRPSESSFWKTVQSLFMDVSSVAGTRNAGSLSSQGMGSERIIPLAPFGGTLLSEEITLKWEGGARGRPFTVRLFDTAEQVVWETVTTQKTATLPRGQSPLEQGREYGWSVVQEGMPVAGSMAVTPRPFRVLTKDEAKRIERNAKSAGVVQAGQKQSAASLMRAALFYAECGLTVEADHALEQALGTPPSTDEFSRLAQAVRRANHASLAVTCFGRKAGESDAVPMTKPVNVLESGASFRISVQAMRHCYPYAFLIGSRGEWFRFWPVSEAETPAPLDALATLVLPSPYDEYPLDGNTGKELIIVLAATEPLRVDDQLEAAVRQFAQNPILLPDILDPAVTEAHLTVIDHR